MGIRLYNKVPNNIKKVEEYKPYKRKLKLLLLLLLSLLTDFLCISQMTLKIHIIAMTITITKIFQNKLLTSCTINTTLIIHNKRLGCSKAEAELMYTYKAIPVLAWTGLECSKRWRIPDLKTIET